MGQYFWITKNGASSVTLHSFIDLSYHFTINNIPETIEYYKMGFVIELQYSSFKKKVPHDNMNKKNHD